MSGRLGVTLARQALGHPPGRSHTATVEVGQSSRRNEEMALRVVNCIATAPDSVVVFFSDNVVHDNSSNSASASNVNSYAINTVDPSSGGPFRPDSIDYDPVQKAAKITLTDTAALQQGQWIEVKVTGDVATVSTPPEVIQHGTTGNDTFYCHVNGTDVLGGIADTTNRIAESVRRT